jgi:hypothetical protein
MTRVLFGLVVTLLQAAPGLGVSEMISTCDNTPVDELKLLDKAALQRQYCIFLARQRFLTGILEIDQRFWKKLMDTNVEAPAPHFEHEKTRALEKAKAQSDDDATALDGCRQMVTRTARVMAARGFKVSDCPAPPHAP